MLTKDETELYDRQIRLWGVNAQSKIRQSKVMMLGFNGIASEVAKILVLAGIDTLTIVDDRPLQRSDITSNLFCRTPNPDEGSGNFRTHAVVAKLKRLNPLVNVTIMNSSILSMSPEEFKNFDLVTLHSFLTIEQTCNINDMLREMKVKFYVVLDFGFFGFLFNDLGPEFKFSYEEYCASDKAKQIGDNSHPITVGEDEVNGDDEQTDSLENHDSSSRPKKRRRMYSPSKKEESKEASEEKKTKNSSFPYVTFRELISVKGFSFTKQTSPVLIVTIALYKFYSKFERFPNFEDSDSAEKDLSELNRLITDMRESVEHHEVIFKRLDPDWPKYIHGSLSPVCAVLGGVAGQDMIRALSHKDIPISNTFSFDGISMNGIVEKTGFSSSQSLVAQPIVRDLVTLDDDDDDIQVAA